MVPSLLTVFDTTINSLCPSLHRYISRIYAL